MSSSGELLQSLNESTEKRYDLRIIVVGHLAGGKSTVIKKLLNQAVDIRKRESTNGVVIIRKGGIQIKDGKWFHKKEHLGKEEILKRMASAIKKTDLEKRELGTKTMKITGRHQLQKLMDDLAQIKYTDPDEEVICHLLFSDFAGQSVFNSCHQMFMSHRAIYLVVLNISLPLNSEVDDDGVFCLGANQRMSVIEITRFLLSSVHMYSGGNEYMLPKVLLLGTHSDKVKKEVAEQRMSELKNSLNGTPLQEMVVGDFLVNNSVDDDKGIKAVKEKIFEVGKGEYYWGEERPALWMPLEKEIMIKRQEGHRVLTKSDLYQINKQCYVQLIQEEIEKFLIFHNDIGNIMFFGGKELDDIVILDPEWLTDSLKQIITHEQFYTRFEGSDEVWNDFTHSAKLSKILIQAVWSKNKDKTFIKHMDKLLSILQATDIISCPKKYDDNGSLIEQDFYFVPSMLRPHQDSIAIINTLIQNCRGVSPTLCFVFKNKFMPPAIFSRIQAACTSVHRIKEINGKVLLFFRTAMFRLNNTYDLHIEHVENVIRVTVISENDKNIRSRICQDVLSYLEETLQNIVKLYCKGGMTLPFYKAIQCKKAEGKLDALHCWEELLEKEEILCKKHTPMHRSQTSDIMGKWRISESEYQHAMSQQNAELCTSTLENLSDRKLGRLARCLSNEKLRLVASTVLGLPTLDNLEKDYKNRTVDFNFAILRKWKNTEKEISIDTLEKAFAENHEILSSSEIEQALSDKDPQQCFYGIPNPFLDKAVNDLSIDYICSKIGKLGRQLAIELEFESCYIDQIEMDQPHSVIDSCRVFLKKWQSSSIGHTNREIGKAIVEVGMDIAIIKDCFNMSLKNNERSGEQERQKSMDKDKDNTKQRCFMTVWACISLLLAIFAIALIRMMDSYFEK